MSTVRFCVCRRTVLLITENEADNSDCSGYTSVPPVLFVQEMTGPLDFSNSVIIITVISQQTSDTSPVVLKYKNKIEKKIPSINNATFNLLWVTIVTTDYYK